MATKIVDGQIFGRLTVLLFSHKDKWSSSHYSCRCLCGTEKIIDGRALKRGATTSCGCFQKERAGKAALKSRKNGRMVSAKAVWSTRYKDGCSFELFLELSQKPCFYCGTLPTNSFNNYLMKNGNKHSSVSQEWIEQSAFIYNSLDRIDSNFAHIETNIVPCCKMCNYAKRDMTLDQFREWARTLTTHLNEAKW